MKGIIIVFFFPIFVLLAQTQEEFGEIKFVEETFDFGVVPQKSGANTKITHDFLFTNVGKKPVTIQNIETSCYCTVAKYPTEPINSTQKGKITVEYDATKVGPFYKYVTLTTNSKTSTKMLFIKGSVEVTPPANPTVVKTTTPKVVTPVKKP